MGALLRNNVMPRRVPLITRVQRYSKQLPRRAVPRRAEPGRAGRKMRTGRFIYI